MLQDLCYYSKEDMLTNPDLMRRMLCDAHAVINTVCKGGMTEKQKNKFLSDWNEKLWKMKGEINA